MVMDVSDRQVLGLLLRDGLINMFFLTKSLITIIEKPVHFRFKASSPGPCLRPDR